MGAITFIHTADWQIGKPFGSITDEEKRQRLMQARIDAIGRLGQLVSSTGASFVIVAGDLFDSPTVTDSTISATLAKIGALQVPVHVIPGNHDHGGPAGIWARPHFLHEWKSLAPNLQVHLESEPVEVDDAVLLPCPLLRRHEAIDPTAWVRDIDWGEVPAKPRIVLAHGGVHGFTTESDGEDSGGAANRLTLERLPVAEIDFIALGDWHGTKEVGPKAWYAGALEQDRFPKGDDYSAGNALVVTVERGGNPSVSIERTGNTQWHRTHYRFTDDSAMPAFETFMQDLLGSRVGEDLLELDIEGALGFAEMEVLQRQIEVWEGRLIRLKLSDRVQIAPTEEEITSLTQRPSDPLISRVATELRQQSDGTGENVELARLALRELYLTVAR